MPSVALPLLLFACGSFMSLKAELVRRRHGSDMLTQGDPEVATLNCDSCLLRLLGRPLLLTLIDPVRLWRTCDGF